MSLVMVFVLVALAGGMYPATVSHAAHHATHHGAATHATVLCAWYCGAGQTAEFSSGVDLNVVVRSQLAVDLVPISAEPILSVACSSRAPPASSV